MEIGDVDSKVSIQLETVREKRALLGLCRFFNLKFENFSRLLNLKLGLKIKYQLS